MFDFLTLNAPRNGVSISLFVLFTGPNKSKKASKNTLARWMKSAITEAYKAASLTHRLEQRLI